MSFIWTITNGAAFLMCIGISNNLQLSLLLYILHTYVMYFLIW